MTGGEPAADSGASSTEGELRKLVAQYGIAPSKPVRALTYLKKWGSASAPVLLSCDDNHAYVVKGAFAGRQIVNEHVVAHLGRALGAPVGGVALVEVGAELIESEPELKDHRDGKPFQAGIWHGSRYLQGLSDDREGINHAAIPENRERFALLALLYGWAQASDHQFLYAKIPPQLVYSVDHGHFFPSGPDWTVHTLRQAAGAQPDQAISSQCSLTPDEIALARVKLSSIDALETVARAVAAPPAHWPFAPDERIALGSYLHERHGVLASPAAA